MFWWMFYSGYCVKNGLKGDFPVVQWLRLCASNAGGAGSIPGQGTKIPHASWHGQKLKKKKKNRLKGRNRKTSWEAVAIIQAKDSSGWVWAGNNGGDEKWLKCAWVLRVAPIE